ncbi:MAG TPA: transcriptional repressor LexA [Candidatus Merdivicinus intestinigallinarum]|nr:transcriptional repressor LexA [Candidatus Merdivicinus intestinigallinarum]
MLSEKGKKIYDYIRDCILNRGFSPTVREIGEELGIKSTSTVHYYLKELAEEGYIIKDSMKKRTIKLPSSDACAVPLLGTVTAGLPITAIEEVEEYISIPNLTGDSDDYFALHVRGDSMIGTGILDGDIIVVKKTPVCHNGDIVVALIDDEATVKRLYKEKGYFRLMPENPAYEPIIVEEVTILGKIAALVRNY